MKKLRLKRKRKLALIAFAKDLYAYCRLRMDKKFWNDLSPVFERSVSSGCDYSELLLLYNQVLRKRPQAILELGSGISTVVIAHALDRTRQSGHHCKFVSMEEDESYFLQLKEIFPRELIQYVELVNSPVEDRELPGGFISRYYVHKPRAAYDFVFIDGPQVPKVAGHFDGDLLDVLEWNPEAFVAFLDQRIITRDALKEMLPFARVSESKEFAIFNIPPASDRQPFDRRASKA